MGVTRDLSKALEFEPWAQRVRADLDTQQLVGSRCGDCGFATWPARAVCSDCGSPMVSVRSFARWGLLVSFTVVHVPRPGLPSPYALGQVRLEDGPMVFARLEPVPSRAELPLRVRSRAAASEDPASAGPLRIWFEPVDDAR